ncbi:putative periplasmic protein [Labilithrix luteola]|uniref:Putative periplasmic protein n=1 Tax=Labilithrix luteola TaxID=1391654 RepID=A0A0K1PRH3_9BACT|nr:GDSL-type esterase/lipase family protein [Labilithrix luteola]AKU96127.1 putative periplasmic protein [Labilithrix luteola]
MRRGFAKKVTWSTNAKPNVAISKRAFVAAAIALTLPSLGCGDSLPKAKPAADADGPNGSVPANRDAVASVPAEIVSRTHAGVVGALERPAALRRFFESLGRLESEQAQDDVRIVQFGDSHTAADIETGSARHALQTRFGDGGRGFVAIGKPWKQYLQEGVRCGMSSDWSGERGKLERGKFVGDGMYGLAGIGLGSSQRGARAWTDITARTSRAEINYLEQPNGGSFDVFVDGVRVVRVSTRADRAASAFRTFDITPSTAHQVEVRGVGDGDVRVFGLSLDRAEHGIVFDALGINGARVTTCLQWNEQHWAEQLKHRAPALVILAYGTNESTDEGMSPETYERQLVDTLGRIARAVPSASCLLLGPPDRAISEGKDKEWVTAPKLLEIIASQKRVAAAAGCAFYDQLTAMGGSGTIAGWASEDPPRAQKDRVHLTREGYAQLGSSFAADLMRAYVGWRKELGLPSTSAPAPALEASQ